MRGKPSLPPASLAAAANEPGQLPPSPNPPPHPFRQPTAVVPLPSSPPSLPLPPAPAHAGSGTPAWGDPRNPTSRMTPSTHEEDIQGKAKRLFWRRGGGPCSSIAVSCRIKEASKIAALNYILADERHANNGRCKRSLHEEPWHEWSYSLQRGWGPCCGAPTGSTWPCALPTHVPPWGPHGDGQSSPGWVQWRWGHRGAGPRHCQTAKGLYSCSQGRVKHRGRRDVQMLMKLLSSSDRF